MKGMSRVFVNFSTSLLDKINMDYNRRIQEQKEYIAEVILSNRSSSRRVEILDSAFGVLNRLQREAGQEETNTLNSLYNKLASNQRDYDPKIAKAIDSNYWKLI